MALSAQRQCESERDSGPVVRCARVAAALIALLAVRAVVSNAGERAHVAAPWILIVLALGAGMMLREAGRGLSQRLPRPRWSARFAGTWAASSGLLLTVLLTAGGPLGFGAWISIALAVCLGLVLAASWQGTRRLLRFLARLRDRNPVRIRSSALPTPCAMTLTAAVPAPLLAGWSDRGPPLQLS